MQTRVTVAESDMPPTSTFDLTLLDGGSRYGVDLLGRGLHFRARWGAYSEGVAYENPTNAPNWGDWEMFSDGVIGVDFLEEWDLNRGFSPTTYEVLTGDLPDGLVLDSVSGTKGRISGIPEIDGVFNFTLRATNEFGTADKAFSITVVAPTGGGGSYTFIT